MRIDGRYEPDREAFLGICHAERKRGLDSEHVRSRSIPTRKSIAEGRDSSPRFEMTMTPHLRTYHRPVSPRLVALVRHSQYSQLGTRYPLPSFKRMFLLQFFHSRTPLVLKVLCSIHQAGCGFGILAVDPDQPLGSD